MAAADVSRDLALVRPIRPLPTRESLAADLRRFSEALEGRAAHAASIRDLDTALLLQGTADAIDELADKAEGL